MINIKQTKKDGSVNTLNAGHTVTSNLAPDDVNLSSLFFHSVLHDGAIITGTSNSYPLPQYTNMIFNRGLKPFSNGSIVLRNSKLAREIDIMSYFACSDRTEYTDIVGVADMSKVITSSSKLVGTLNAGESETIELNQSATRYKRVFDFPNGKVDSEFDEILILPCGFNSGIGSETTGCVSDYSNGTHHKMFMANPKIKLKWEDTYFNYRFAPDNNGNILATNSYYGSLKYNFVYTENDITASVNIINHDDTSLFYCNVAFLNGKFVIFPSGTYWGSATSVSSQSPYYTVESIVYNKETSKYDFTLSEKQLLPLFDNSIVGGSYYINSAWEMDGNVFLLIQRSSSSNYCNIVKLNLEMTEIVSKWDTHRTDILMHSSSSAHYPTGLIYDPNKKTMIITRGASKLIELSSDLSVTVHEYTFNHEVFVRLYRFPQYNKPLGNFRLDNISYASLNSTGQTFYIGEVTTQWNSLIKIKLNEPMKNVPGETMTITLDMTITNGNIEV